MMPHKTSCLERDLQHPTGLINYQKLSDKMIQAFSEQTKQLKAEIHSNGTHDNIGMMHGIILQKI